MEIKIIKENGRYKPMHKQRYWLFFTRWFPFTYYYGDAVALGLGLTEHTFDTKQKAIAWLDKELSSYTLLCERGVSA